MAFPAPTASAVAAVGAVVETPPQHSLDAPRNRRPAEAAAGEAALPEESGAADAREGLPWRSIPSGALLPSSTAS